MKSQDNSNRYVTPYDQQFQPSKGVDYELEQVLFAGSDPNDFEQDMEQLQEVDFDNQSPL